MRIAIEGCLHGELDIVYNTIKYIEQEHQTKIDLLICCGDFQAVRNEGKDPFHWFWRKFMTSTGTSLWNHYPHMGHRQQNRFI